MSSITSLIPGSQMAIRPPGSQMAVRPPRPQKSHLLVAPQPSASSGLTTQVRSQPVGSGAPAALPTSKPATSTLLSSSNVYRPNEVERNSSPEAEVS